MLGSYESWLASLVIVLIPANFCIVQLPPYRFLHLTTGFVILGAFFVIGPAAIGLLVVSVAGTELLGWFVRRPLLGGPPLGAIFKEYAVPLSSLVLLLGVLDLLRGPLGLAYPFRPVEAGVEARFVGLVLGIWVGFIVLSEIGIHLRFGWRRVVETPHAKSDLALYALVSVVGYPVVADITRQLAADGWSVLRAHLSILWGFGTFLVIATLVRRRLEIERLARRVSTQERLAALGRLASVVAHQTRHLLGVLNMSAYVLDETLSRETLSPSTRKTVDRELDAIARTRDELDRLLTRELQGSSDSERFGLLALARECVEQLRPMSDRKQLALRAEGEPVEILGDRIRLKQAVSNVLRNAIEAAPEGSPVEIEVVSAAGEARLSVRDRGPGLSEAARSHLFEPLFTEKAGGLGMGLYVARAIVEAHGGTLALETDRGCTEATIGIPRAA